jgi:hypothetical protein
LRLREPSRQNFLRLPNFPPKLFEAAKLSQKFPPKLPAKLFEAAKLSPKIPAKNSTKIPPAKN